MKLQVLTLSAGQKAVLSDGTRILEEYGQFEDGLFGEARDMAELFTKALPRLETGGLQLTREHCDRSTAREVWDDLMTCIEAFDEDFNDLAADGFGSSDPTEFYDLIAKPETSTKDITALMKNYMEGLTAYLRKESHEDPTMKEREKFIKAVRMAVCVNLALTGERGYTRYTKLETQEKEAVDRCARFAKTALDEHHKMLDREYERNAAAEEEEGMKL